MQPHNKLTPIWTEVEALLTNGLNLIPVRDKEQGDYAAKTPYRSWKKYMTEVITKDDLWAQMERYNTTAVALVCGRISGNIEVIDIDSKYKKGISGQVFAILEKTFPEIWHKLRIHKTPSGGYHLLYKVSNPPETFPGNTKLAGRLATESELKEKPKTKVYYFLETRGEGGFVLLPPSLGYSLYRDVEIPAITWEDRCDVIAVMRSFHEIMEPKRKVRKSKKEESYYNETPWEHVNRDTSVIPEIMEEKGWKICKQIGSRTYFTRPDKEKGISASFNEETNMLWVFTSSSDLESEKGYNPASLIADTYFNGDTRKTFQYLIGKGYGSVKERVEESIVKTKALAGKPLPPNFSDRAKKHYELLKEEIKTDFPYGLFWTYDANEEKWKISREDVYAVSFGLGFRIHRDDIVRIEGCFVEKVDKGYYFNAVKDYIREEDADIYKDICNAYESFLQRSGKFTIERLTSLDTSLIVRDTPDKCFKFYQNVLICITADEIRPLSYDKVTDRIIWKHKVLDRDWDTNTAPKGVYEEFLENATGNGEHVRNVIGWLCHEYKSESTGYIIVLTEKVVNPKDGGGSGKNIFGNILKHSTSVCTVPGSMVSFDVKFLQPWNHENIYFLADIPKEIEWLFLKEVATGNGMLKKLWQNEAMLEVDDMPKILLNTNYSYSDSDGGLKRRIIVVEFSDYYTKNGGVDTVHGKMFPADFTKEDWAAFDQFIARCISGNIAKKGKLKPTDLSDSGWQKKFAQEHGFQTLEFIKEQIDGWLNIGFVSKDHFNEQYQHFCTENDITGRWKKSSEKMNEAIDAFCRKYGYAFDPKGRIRVNGLRTSGKSFSRNDGDTLPPVEDMDDELPF